MGSDGSDKSRLVALVLAALIGVFGVHRFYVGKVGTGLLMLLTFGGFGIWYLYDLVLIAAGGFTDVDNRKVIYWTEDEMRALGVSAGSRRSSEVMEEIDQLRSEVMELSERVDFTERLLTRARTSGELDSRSP